MADPKINAALAAAVHKAAAMPDAPGLASDAESLVRPVVEPPAAAAPSLGPAGSAHARLVGYIRSFEAQLDANHEIAMGFAASNAGVLKIEGLGYHDSDLITFYGRDEDGNKTQLVQHVAQLSVMLRAVPKQDEQPANRIGFRLDAGWQGGEAGDASV